MKLRIRSLALLILPVMLALPGAALAEGSDSTTPAASKAHGLLRAAQVFDAHAAKFTARADALQATAATFRTEAAAVTPADEVKIAKATKLEAQATKFDAAAAKFTAKAVAFRAKAAARLTEVDDEAAAAKPAKKAHGLIRAATNLRAHAAKAIATATTLRTEAAATTPVDEAKIAKAVQHEARAAKFITNATRLEAFAAKLAASAEAAAAAA